LYVIMTAGIVALAGMGLSFVMESKSVLSRDEEGTI